MGGVSYGIYFLHNKKAKVIKKYGVGVYDTLKKGWMYASSVGDTLFFSKMAVPIPWNICFS